MHKVSLGARKWLSMCTPICTNEWCASQELTTALKRTDTDLLERCVIRNVLLADENDFVIKQKQYIY